MDGFIAEKGFNPWSLLQLYWTEEILNEQTIKKGSIAEFSVLKLKHFKGVHFTTWQKEVLYYKKY